MHCLLLRMWAKPELIRSCPVLQQLMQIPLQYHNSVKQGCNEQGLKGRHLHCLVQSAGHCTMHALSHEGDNLISMLTRLAVAERSVGAAEPDQAQPHPA